MAKHNRRNRPAVNKVDFRNVKEGLYLDEKSFGDVHLLNEVIDENGEKMYVYKGALHRGTLTLVTGKTLKVTIPSVGYNCGWTLEGDANEIFTVEDALVCYNPAEHRTFCYNNEHSKLTFTGDTNKEYEMHIHVYDNCHGELNNRWVVIWAKEL
jgi:hypothetical protein